MCMHLQMTRLLCVPAEVCKSDNPQACCAQKHHMPGDLGTEHLCKSQPRKIKQLRMLLVHPSHIDNCYSGISAKLLVHRPCQP